MNKCTLATIKKIVDFPINNILFSLIEEQVKSVRKEYDKLKINDNTGNNTFIFNQPYYANIELFIINNLIKDSSGNLVLLHHNAIPYWENILKANNKNYTTIKTLISLNKYIKLNKQFDYVLIKDTLINISKLSIGDKFLDFIRTTKLSTVKLVDYLYYIDSYKLWDNVVIYNPISLKLEEYDIASSIESDTSQSPVKYCYISNLLLNSVNKYIIYDSLNISTQFFNVIKAKFNYFDDFKNCNNQITINKYSYINTDYSINMLSGYKKRKIITRNNNIEKFVNNAVVVSKKFFNATIKFYKSNSVENVNIKIIKKYTSLQYDKFDYIVKMIEEKNEGVESIIYDTLSIQVKDDIVDILNYIKFERNKIKCIMERIVESLAERECSICFEEYRGSVILMSCCQKSICSICAIKGTYKQYLNYSTIINGICPFCNKYIDIENDMIFFDKNNKYRVKNKLDTKNTYLSTILTIYNIHMNNCTNDKTIRETIHGSYIFNYKLPKDERRTIVLSYNNNFIKYSSYKLRMMGIKNIFMRSNELEKKESINVLIYGFIEDISIILINLNKHSNTIYHALSVIFEFTSNVIFLDWDSMQDDIIFMNIISLCKKNVNVHLLPNI